MAQDRVQWRFLLLALLNIRILQPEGWFSVFINVYFVDKRVQFSVKGNHKQIHIQTVV